MPPAFFERLLQQLEDLKDARLVRERMNSPFIKGDPGKL